MTVKLATDLILMSEFWSSCDIFRILLPEAYVNSKWLMLTKMAKTVTNMFKLSPTHYVSNIRHRHRCNRQNVNPSQVFFSELNLPSGYVQESKIEIFLEKDCCIQLAWMVTHQYESPIWLTIGVSPRVFCLGVLFLFSCITVHLHILDPVSHTYDLHCRSISSRLNWASWSQMVRKFRMNKC